MGSEILHKKLGGVTNNAQEIFLEGADFSHETENLHPPVGVNEDP